MHPVTRRVSCGPVNQLLVRDRTMKDGTTLKNLGLQLPVLAYMTGGLSSNRNGSRHKCPRRLNDGSLSYLLSIRSLLCLWRHTHREILLSSDSRCRVPWAKYLST